MRNSAPLIFLFFIMVGVFVFNMNAREEVVNPLVLMQPAEKPVTEGILISANYLAMRKAYLDELRVKPIDSVSLSAWCDSFFVGRQGFIRSPHLYRFFRLMNDADTAGHLWDFVKSQNEYTGKYYKTGSRYLVCFENYGDFEYHHIYLMDHETKNWKVVTDSVFYHGNYPCCWNGKMNGFGYDRGYFYIDVCGTGSAFCSQHREIIEVSGDSLFVSVIPMDFYDSGYHEFVSAAKIDVLTKSEMIVSYDQKVFPVLEEDKGPSKYPKRRMLKIRYRKENNQFVFSDTLYQLKTKGFFWSDWWY